jgi:DNA-binding response OmpR family regulator
MGRIALVEDNPDSADLVRAMLDDEHTVEWFPNGRTFLEFFPSDKFDLVLLDVALPEMDGYQILAWIRTQNPSMPVIILSAHASAEELRSALERGISDYVVKPIHNMQAFREKVRRHIQGGGPQEP